MGYLTKKSVYLSMPMEYTNEYSITTEQKDKLSNDFGLDLFDPTQDPKQQWVKDIIEAKKNKDYKTIRRIAKSFVRKDLSKVDESKILIAFVPPGVRTTGLVHEVVNAINAKKPVLLVGPMESIPTWFFGIVPLEGIFNNFDELYTYLQEVDNGEHKDNDRWSVVYELV